MSVSLVWATPNADSLIADMARVSSPQNVGKDATRLIEYLIRNSHWSPFEMAAMCVSIRTTRDIGRQILRHGIGFRFQEFSYRYSTTDALPAAPLREARLQDVANRQNSMRCDDVGLAGWWRVAQQRVLDEATAVYQEALAQGIAKEQARVVLPEGLTPSHLYMQGNIRSWLHYCALRRGNGTQAEHCAIADAAWDVLRQVAPACTAAWEASQ
jgi:thymidylate synthase (FAD)